MLAVETGTVGGHMLGALTHHDDEDNARSKKLGLWGGNHKPIAPWDWRKLSKVERDEFR